MPTSCVKRAYKYRFYPTPEQAAELARTFGCARKVYNMALTARTGGRPGHRAAGGDRATVGVDVGLDHLLTLSTGEKIANPRHEQKDRKRLAKAQRELSRKAKGSANRDTARQKVARVHARIADRRRDLLHKLTTRLVRENQTIVIEDLTVRNMLKNHSLSRAISSAAWREFRSMLEYKAAWYGRQVVVVDRWFPSSKLCSTCGALQPAMSLDVRVWMCTCGITHDRDVNAAKNLLAAGLAVSACGAGVRPRAGSLPNGAVGAEAGSLTARTVGIHLFISGEEVK